MFVTMTERMLPCHPGGRRARRARAALTCADRVAGPDKTRARDESDRSRRGVRFWDRLLNPSRVFGVAVDAVQDELVPGVAKGLRRRARRGRSWLPCWLPWCCRRCCPVASSGPCVGCSRSSRSCWWCSSSRGTGHGSTGRRQLVRGDDAAVHGRVDRSEHLGRHAPGDRSAARPRHPRSPRSPPDRRRDLVDQRDHLRPAGTGCSTAAVRSPARADRLRIPHSCSRK